MDDVKYVNILNKLATALNDDYQWCIKTQVILENDNKLTDPATVGFLKGVEYVTSQLLDILESDQIEHLDCGSYPDDGICLCDMNIVGGKENE